MIELAIPGRGTYKLQYLVLDLNGTLALDGRLAPGVEERLEELSQSIEIVIATADTYGTAHLLEEDLGLRVERMAPGDEDRQKLPLVQGLGAESTVCMGNGANDVLMLEACALGICVLGREGASSQALAKSGLVFNNALDALDALSKPRRLIASLRR